MAMTIHLIKLVVGAEDMPHFLEIQRRYEIPYDGSRAIPVRTRFKPKRDTEVLTGGSLYRVIKNRIQCRQEILGFEEIEDKDKGTQCLIMVSPVIIKTVSTPFRPFQGWRYLDPAKAPADRGEYKGAENDDIPPEMEAELKNLGLI